MENFASVKLSKALLAGAALTLMPFVASAASVTYTCINDSNASGGFTCVGTMPDGGDPNQLNLGLDDFSVSAAANGAGDSDSLFDTISFLVDAPSGYVITGAHYEEKVVGSLSYTNAGGANGAVVLATGSLVVNNTTYSLGNFFEDNVGTPGLILFTDLAWDASDNLTNLEVAVTNNLTAFAWGDGEASLVKEPASFSVTLSQVPLPPAVWLLGSALLGLITINRRRAAA